MNKYATLLLMFVGLQILSPQVRAQTNLELQLQGLCYGPFRDGQSPVTSVFPTTAEITEDLRLLRPVTRAVRTYSVGGVLGEVPALARKQRLTCYAGAWVGPSNELNQAEIARLLDVAAANKPAALIVGNEVLLQGSLPAEELIGLIRQIKAGSKLPVGYADTWEQWLAHPEVAAEVDILLVHVHPYWDEVAVSNAAKYVLQRLLQVKNTYSNKTVIVGETGWPSAGATNGAAIPSAENQCRFLEDFVTIATANSVPYFFFEATDEAWKQISSGVEVEAHWGLFTTTRQLKSCVQSLFDAPPPLVEILKPAKCGAVRWSPIKLSGRVYGLPVAERSQYRVVVYTLTNQWYVQPWTAAPFTTIRRDGAWKQRTHMGSKYAALLVNRTYSPSPVLATLPEIGGDVLALSVAECTVK